ncbi:MAG: histidinol-phosphate transaminase [Micrococcales bacterium]|nr:histidinol-phosphate transaminase [Micrococcales bacterium]
MASPNDDLSWDRPAARLPVRPELAAARPYGAPQPPVAVPLNVNENPYSPPTQVVRAISKQIEQAATQLNRYPDRDFTQLRQALAAYLAKESQATGLAADNIWAANGSNEVMLHIFQAFGGPGRTALSFDPTYSMYPEYARNTYTAWATGDRRPDFSIDPSAGIGQIKQTGASLVLLASPNNPTGTAVPLSLVDQMCAESAGQALIVVDEAYAEFRPPGMPSALSLLGRHNNLVVTRTMSKAFALAGARLGYAAGSAELIGYLRTVRLPYHLSTLTQVAASAALAQADLMLARVAELRQSRDQLRATLLGLGLACPDSAANFLLFGHFESADLVWRDLLDQGVLVRQVGPPGYLRVSVGSPDQNRRFVQALTKAIDKMPGALALEPPQEGEIRS